MLGFAVPSTAGERVSPRERRLYATLLKRHYAPVYNYLCLLARDETLRPTSRPRRSGGFGGTCPGPRGRLTAGLRLAQRSARVPAAHRAPGGGARRRPRKNGLDTIVSL
jgi:hypothetical protein